MRRLELRVNGSRVAPTNTSELMMDGETSLSRYEIARWGEREVEMNRRAGAAQTRRPDAAYQPSAGPRLPDVLFSSVSITERRQRDGEADRPIE